MAEEKSYKKVADHESAGDIWFYTNTYKIFHEGIKLLLAEVRRLQDLMKKFDLEKPPYEDDAKDLSIMINWGENHRGQTPLGTGSPDNIDPKWLDRESISEPARQFRFTGVIFFG